MTETKFNEFVRIMRTLRRECPWDREQTNESIKLATIEEAYEVVEAIDDNDFDELKKELGDLLLHVAFHSVIAEDLNKFTIDDVIDGITEKLIRRHPHVFGVVNVENTNEVMKNWEAIKLAEGKKSVLDGVPKNLPALIKAFKIQEKVSKVGFDWDDKKDVFAKVTEELNELKAAELSGDQNHIEEEFGDLLFALTNYARFIKVNPESALNNSCKKFQSRFTAMEEKITKDNKKVFELSLTEMDVYWEQVKKESRE